MIKCNNSYVIEAIIDCLNLPISKKCNFALIDRTSITFIMDEYDNNSPRVTINDIWSNIEFDYWGCVLRIMHSGDIKDFKIEFTGKPVVRLVNYYTRLGKIKFGRYYEPSMD